MNVKYYGPIPGVGHANIMFEGKWPMLGGKFPKAHPCASNPKPMSFGIEDQPASDDGLGKFRSCGYWASCFPDGDGIVLRAPNRKTTPDVVRDIETSFGWTVKVMRP